MMTMTMMMMMIIIIIMIITIIANWPTCKLLIARPTDQGSNPCAYAGDSSSSSSVLNHDAHAYIIRSNARSRTATQNPIKGPRHTTKVANTATLVARIWKSTPSVSSTRLKGWCRRRTRACCVIHLCTGTGAATFPLLTQM